MGRDNSGTADITRIVTPEMIGTSIQAMLERMDHDELVALTAAFFLVCGKFSVRLRGNESVLQCGVRGFSDFRSMSRDLNQIFVYPVVQESSWRDRQRRILKENSKYDPTGKLFGPFLVNFHGADQFSRLCAMADILNHALVATRGRHFIEEPARECLMRVTERFMLLSKNNDPNFESPLRHAVSMPYNLGTRQTINLGASSLSGYDLVMAGDDMRSHIGERLQSIREIWHALTLTKRALLATTAQIGEMVDSGRYNGQWFLPDVATAQRIVDYKGKGEFGRGFYGLLTCPEDSACRGTDLPALTDTGIYVDCEGRAASHHHQQVSLVRARLVRLKKICPESV